MTIAIKHTTEVKCQEFYQDLNSTEEKRVRRGVWLALVAIFLFLR